MTRCDDCGREIELGPNRDERWEFGYATFCKHCGPGQDLSEPHSVVEAAGGGD
jgi:hypothetical protein